MESKKYSLFPFSSAFCVFPPVERTVFYSWFLYVTVMRMKIFGITFFSEDRCRVLLASSCSLSLTYLTDTLFALCPSIPNPPCFVAGENRCVFCVTPSYSFAFRNHLPRFVLAASVGRGTRVSLSRFSFWVFKSTIP